MPRACPLESIQTAIAVDLTAVPDSDFEVGSFLPTEMHHFDASRPTVTGIESSDRDTAAEG
eukprot:m.19624 g.19624  ORF g.19624 m.19624 type:complete len:61 (-) comp5463_c0_seq2:1198-1380(-)